MANVVLGKVAISWKGEWSTSLTYTKQDVVRNGASAYICVADASTPGTFDTDVVGTPLHRSSQRAKTRYGCLRLLLKKWYTCS